MGAPCLELADHELKTDSLVECLFDTLGSNSVVTAESCTGGLIAAAITERAGSSQFFERGFVTYSNQAKIDELQVPMQILDDHGAVSAQTAEAMALGALKNSKASIAVSVTGIAGPSGETNEKPVGLVYIGIADRETNEVETYKHVFSGDRQTIRAKTTIFALRYVLRCAENLNLKVKNQS